MQSFVQIMEKDMETDATIYTPAQIPAVQTLLNKYLIIDMPKAYHLFPQERISLKRTPFIW